MYILTTSSCVPLSIGSSTLGLHKHVLSDPGRHYWQTESRVLGLAREYLAGVNHSLRQISNHVPVL
jgi:hypothetical protein